MRWHNVREKPERAGIGANELLLAWHRYNGVLVTTADEIGRNRFFTHWRRIPDIWIDPRERLPDKSDADVYGCVLIRRSWGEILEIGWWQVRNALHIDGWTHNPSAP